MKTTKEMIEVMQAYERGESIQFRRFGAEQDWTTAPHPGWDWDRTDYRVEPEQPKTIAFGLTAEQLIGAVVKWKDIVKCIISISDEYIYIGKKVTHISNIDPSYELYRAPYAPREVQERLAEKWGYEL